MSASVARRRRRIEALLHAHLRDAGFYLCVESAGRDEYRHRVEPFTAFLDRTDVPTLLAAVTLVAEATGKAVGMACRPDDLRVLLGRFAVLSDRRVRMLTVVS